MDINYGTIACCDFSEDTITFEMENPFTVQGATRFAIIKLDTIQDQIDLEEFLNTKK